jgi:hypothetical protein
LRSKAGAAARVRTYVDGEAGGLEAAGRRVGEQRRWDGRLPQAPRRQHRRPHVVAPLFRSEILFFGFFAFPVCSAASAPFVPTAHGGTTTTSAHSSWRLAARTMPRPGSACVQCALQAAGLKVCSFDWWLMLVCSERKVLLAGY